MHFHFLDFGVIIIKNKNKKKEEKTDQKAIPKKEAGF